MDLSTIPPQHTFTRTMEDLEGAKKKKRKEGRREKPKRSKNRADEGDDDFDQVNDADGGRTRRKKRGAVEGAEAPRRRKRTPSVERDDLLTPEEREYFCPHHILRRYMYIYKY